VREILVTWEEELGRWADGLDDRFLKTDEAAAFVETVIQSGARLSEEGKRELYAAALVRGLWTIRPDEDQRYRMVDTLARLRPAHLRLFGAARTNREFDVPYGAIVDIGTQDNGFLTQLVPGIPFEALRLDWADLRRAGLVENEPIIGSELPGFAKFITEYGLQFDLFTRLPYEDVHPPDEESGGPPGH